MNSPVSHNLGISACRFCKHYTPEGRRGGTCSTLQSSVSGDWQACSVSAPFFSEDQVQNCDRSLEQEFKIRATTISRYPNHQTSNNLIQN